MTEPLKATRTGALALRSSDGTFGEIRRREDVSGNWAGAGTRIGNTGVHSNHGAHNGIAGDVGRGRIERICRGMERACANGRQSFCAITPHPGEMARLLGSSSREVQLDRVESWPGCGEAMECTRCPEGISHDHRGTGWTMLGQYDRNAGLAKGGSGDVLTGVLAALTAQFRTEDWLRVLALVVYSCTGRRRIWCRRDGSLRDSCARSG